MTKTNRSDGVISNGYVRHAGEKPKSVVVLGTSRGGTSFYAALLRCAGVYMGSELDDNHEDQEFHGSFYPEYSPELFRTAVAARAAQMPGLWGFKLPMASIFAEEYDHILPDPAYVMVYRNPVSAALGEAKRGGEFGLSLEMSLMFFQRMERFGRRSGRPIFISAYERAVRDPTGEMRALAEFLHIDLTPEMIEAGAQASTGDGGGYRLL